MHIPFCNSKCNYCAFYSLPHCDVLVKQEYTSALIKQITAFHTDRKITSIYFGGGTPPVLGCDHLITLLDVIVTNYKLSDDCEITLEVNPKSVTFSELKKLRTAGFNRISMGMQSSNNHELAVLGRQYNLEEYNEAVQAVKDAGFVNWSTDIIFGIPEQTLQSLTESVMTAINANVPHISAYSLSIEEGTPFFQRKDSLHLPDENAEEEMYDTLCSLLKKHGYQHYEISSFSKEGFASKHNLHYWDCGEYISFGAAAHSYYNCKRFSNIADVQQYCSLVSKDYYSPTDYSLQPFLSDEDKREERIMLGLRTDKGILLTDELLIKSKKYVENGYAVLQDGHLFLTDKGYRISNIIIAELV